MYAYPYILVLLIVIYIADTHNILHIYTIYNICTSLIYTIPHVYTALLGGPYSVDDANRAPFPFDLSYLCPDMSQEDVKVKVSIAYSVSVV